MSIDDNEEIIMPSLLGTLVTANYLKAAPSTRFGTRALAVQVVTVTDIGVNYENSNSTFAQVVRALQQATEVFGIFQPSGNQVTVLVAADTTAFGNGEPGDGNRNSYLEDALDAAGFGGAEVWNADISGDNINYD